MNKLTCYFSSLNQGSFLQAQINLTVSWRVYLQQDSAVSVSVLLSGFDIKASDLLVQQVNLLLSDVSLTSPEAQLDQQILEKAYLK